MFLVMGIAEKWRRNGGTYVGARQGSTRAGPKRRENVKLGE